MKGLIFFSSIAASSALISPSYSFEQYIAEFNKKWTPGSDEYSVRKELFENELARVIKHNNGQHLWTEGINKYSAYSKQELKAFKGRSKAVHQAHVPKYQQMYDLKHVSVQDLPTSVDWRNSDVVTSVKDQGHCGSCWAFASAATLESHLAISSGLLYDLSPQQIAMCSPNPDSCGGTGGCEGATGEVAYDYIANSTGILEEYQLGYQAYYGVDSACPNNPLARPVAKISGYTKLPVNDYTALMNAVATVGPVMISVDASTWHSYSSGIFNGCNQVNPDINHGVVLVGYGEENGQKYWTVRNSWSPSWGEKGYIRLARSDAEQDNCGLDITPEDGSACAGDTTPVTTCGTCGILFDTLYPTGVRRT